MDYAVMLAGPPAAINRKRLNHRIHRLITATRRKLVSGQSLTRFNAAPGNRPIPLPKNLASLVGRAKTLGLEAGGAFDITAAPIESAWQHAWSESHRQNTAPSLKTLSIARERSGLGLIRVRSRAPALRKLSSGVRINLRPLVPSVAAERLATRLDRSGVHDYRIRVGPVLRVGGYTADGRRWPQNSVRSGHTRFTAARPAQAGACLPASAKANDLPARAAPLIDPRTGRPVAHDSQPVTVTARNAVAATAYATALCVMGLKAGGDYAHRHALAARWWKE